MTGADMLSFYSDDSLVLAYAASAAPTGAISGYVLVEHTLPDGEHDVKTVEIVVSTFTTDRTRVVTTVAGGPTGCIVTGGGLFLNGTGLKRGQLYAQLIVRRGGNAAREECVASGYLSDARPYVALGENIEPGPGGGEGVLTEETLINDSAPAASNSYTLAATNARHRIYGFSWYYNCAAGVATRTLDARLRKPDGATPTGFTAANANVWASPTLTLTTGEEGAMFVRNPGGRGDGYVATNDNGTLAVASTATAPNPFPLETDDNTAGTLEFDIGAADAGDRHTLTLFYEEWLVI